MITVFDWRVASRVRILHPWSSRNPMDNKELKSAVDVLDTAALCRKLGMVHHFVLEVAENTDIYYEHFERIKKKGGSRQISASTGRLKHLQRQLLKGLLSKIAMPTHVHGCIKERSVVSNAAGHVGQDVVVNLDLKNFFGTINSARVNSIFQDQLGLNEECALLFTKLCTHQNHLPQGAPTSPALANLAALVLDEKILTILNTKYAYSRYVDDITISGASGVETLIPQIYTAIVDSGFVCNLEKTRILRQSVRQSVTGIVVNKTLNPSKGLIRKIRQDLFYCKKYGLHEHCEWTDTLPNNFVRKLRGSIGYVRMTQPVLADHFTALLKEVLPMSQTSEEEKNIMLLKSAIDNERVISFTYEKSYRQAAPVDIHVDEYEGTIQVKAFQFAPEPGWMEYSLALMSDLTAKYNR